MVLTAFRRYQNGQSIEDFQYFAHSDSIYYAARKLLLKDAKEHLLIKVRDFISMYKALRIGWKEIKHFCPNGTYNTFFIAILKEYYNNTFMRSLSYSEIPTKKIIHSPKDVTLSNFHGNVKIELERLSKDKYIDDSDRELSILTLGKYNQEPHGQDRRLA